MKTLAVCLALLGLLVINNSSASEILVKVGDREITSRQLELAMASAPYATQFPAMDEKDQARLRGDMLLRLVHAEALYQQALKQDLDKDPDFLKELANFQTTLLAQRYLTTIRDQFAIPDSVEKTLQAKYQGNGDALAASRSAYVARQFPEFKTAHIKQLKQRYHVKTLTDKLSDRKALTPDTVLLTGDEISVKAGDLLSQNDLSVLDKNQITSKLEEWSQLLVLARAANDQNIDIQDQLRDYQHQLLINLLLDKKQQEWIPDQNTLQQHFLQHPEIGYIPERRQIGQIVVASEQLARQLSNRIQSGESLFELAVQYSIDPYGREHSGDMGWLPENSGMPEIETALKQLADGEISPVIKTAKGYHLVMIVNRKPAEHKGFAAIKDRVRQAILSEKIPLYLKTVMHNYPLQWTIPDHQ